MSAIVGAYLLDGRKAKEHRLERMVHTMPHRGPDGARVWLGGAVGLGHGALHTTPESLHEVLPLHSEDAGLAITADARIDNRSDLIARLGLERGRDVVTDSELVLSAYRAWGERCVEELLGAFAFAIWDAAERTLFCARDHLGVKPFYFFISGRAFYFGSEIKALLVEDEVPADLDEEHLADTLTLNFESTRSTIYKHVRRLPPAHTITVSPRGVRERKYWTPEPRRDIRASTDEAYGEQFYEVFEEAVRCRMRSAFPIASELSGGLDSSSVACVARDLAGSQGSGDIHAISLLFDRFPEQDERAYIDAVIETGGIVPHPIVADDIGQLAYLKEAFSFIDTPEHARGLFNTILARFKGAREAGARILLTGYDGDSVVGHGYGVLRELVEDGRWEDFAREVRMTSERVQTTGHRQSVHEAVATPSSILSRYALPQLNAYAEQGRYIAFARTLWALHTHVGVDIRQALRVCRRSLVLPRWVSRQPALNAEWHRASGLLDDRFKERVNLQHRATNSVQNRAYRIHRVRQQQQLFFQSAKPSFTLEGLNHSAAGYSIEARHPFMDRRLVEFCLGLPPEQSFKNGWSRVILRRAMQGVIPEVVRLRAGKANAARVSEHWLLNIDGPMLRELIGDVGILAPYLDTAALVRLRRRIEGSKLDGTGFEVGLLSTVAALSYWARNVAPSSLLEGGAPLAQSA